MAADGKITFDGRIVAASCEIGQGDGTNVGGDKGNQTIAVNLGTISTDALNYAQSGNSIAGGTSINLKLNCSSLDNLSKVKVKFDPRSGTGVDAKKNSLLAIETPADGGAKGVGIGIYTTDGTLLNLAANETFDGAFKKSEDGKTGTVELALRAAYVLNGAVTDVVPGTAKASMPFTLTYE